MIPLFPREGKGDFIAIKQKNDLRKHITIHWKHAPGADK